jgi:hypothetical protein
MLRNFPPTFKKMRRLAKSLRLQADRAEREGDYSLSLSLSLINIFVLLIDDHPPPFRKSRYESTINAWVRGLKLTKEKNGIFRQ